MRFLLALLVASPAFAGYASKAPITFAAATGSTQTNITLAFTGSNARFKTVANGGQVRNTVTRAGVTVPADLIITSDATCKTLAGSYTWGIESYSATAGTLVGWLMVPSLTTSATVAATVCVGNPAVVTYQGGAQGAEFDTSTFGKWLMPDGTTLAVNDFSANANVTTNTGGTAATGKIGGGIGLVSASAQYASVANNTAAMGTTDFTVSAWFKTSTTGILQNIMRRDEINNRSFLLRVTDLNKIESLCIFGNPFPDVVGTATVTDGLWHYAVMSVSYAAPNSTMTLYLDGALVGSSSTNGYNNPANVAPLEMGRYQATNEYFNGTLDGLEFDTAMARSANWIGTQYANQNAPPAIGAFTDFPRSQAWIF
jgi:hypothetical protein